MSTKLSVDFVEGSTGVIVASFTDEDDNPVSPATLYWKLTDSEGTVINSRSAEEISTPSSIENIVLSGDDLVIQAGEGTKGYRILTIWGTYNSSYGSDLPIQAAVRFTVLDLVALP